MSPLLLTLCLNKRFKNFLLIIYLSLTVNFIVPPPIVLLIHSAGLVLLYLGVEENFFPFELDAEYFSHDRTILIMFE